MKTISTDFWFSAELMSGERVILDTQCVKAFVERKDKCGCHIVCQEMQFDVITPFEDIVKMFEVER